MRIHCRSIVASILIMLLCPSWTWSQTTEALEAPAPQNRFGLPEPLPKTPGAIRIATYNVLNLFDHVDDPALQGEHDDLPMATSDDRCRQLAATIHSLDADIIALQEVESKQCLEWFRDTWLPDAGYDYIASEDVGYFRGVECSVMSRFPITDVHVWPELPLDDVPRRGPGWDDIPKKYEGELTYRRSPLCVTVKVDDDYELTVFSLHHKSGTHYRFHREAEALKTVELIRGLTADDPARNIVVMGDFNAAPWDKSLRVYLEAGMIDTLAHRVIPRHSQAPQDEAVLYKTHESNRVLDYILLNSAAHRELVIGTPHVVGTLYDADYDWRTDPFPTGYASDHYPVVLDLVPEDRQ